MLPGGRRVVAFRGRILALGRGNLQMLGMAADKCINMYTLACFSQFRVHNSYSLEETDN